MNRHEIFDFVAEDGYGLSCPHCGHISSEDDPVVNKAVHVGGKGYVTELQCADEQACWQRWDEQHGFAKCRGGGSISIDEPPVGRHCGACGKIKGPGGKSSVHEDRIHYEATPERLMASAAAW